MDEAWMRQAFLLFLYHLLVGFVFLWTKMHRHFLTFCKRL
jgi:hypothetical protein